MDENDITKAKPGEMWKYSWGPEDGRMVRNIKIISIDNKTITGIPDKGPNANNEITLNIDDFSFRKISEPIIVPGGGRHRRKSKRRKSKRSKTRRRRN